MGRTKSARLSGFGRVRRSFPASYTAPTPFKENAVLKTASGLFFIVWIWTLVDVADLVNWTLENTPVFLFTGALIFTYRKFKFSNLSYVLIFVFLALHIFGAKYTYAENPLGEWLQQGLESKRNNYDRIVHFLFGFLLAYPMRELCLRYFNFSSKVSNGMPVLACLAFGGLYEIVEGVVVGIFFPEQGLNFLGIQGDLWDPQKDIALAWLGSMCAIAALELHKSAARWRGNSAGSGMRLNGFAASTELLSERRGVNSVCDSRS